MSGTSGRAQGLDGWLRFGPAPWPERVRVHELLMAMVIGAAPNTALEAHSPDLFEASVVSAWRREGLRKHPMAQRLEMRVVRLAISRRPQGPCYTSWELPRKHQRRMLLREIDLATLPEDLQRALAVQPTKEHSNAG